MLRPGNAAPNDTDDHLELLEAAVRAVPARVRASATKKATTPRWWSTPSWSGPTRPGPPTASSNPSTEANFEYSIGFPISGSVRDALLLAQEEDWVRAP